MSYVYICTLLYIHACTYPPSFVADMGDFSAFLTEPNQVFDITSEIAAEYARFLTRLSSVTRTAQCTAHCARLVIYGFFFVLAY